MTTVLVTGGTGFIGQALVKALIDAQHQVIILSRRALLLDEHDHVTYIQSLTQIESRTPIEHIVNLAGEPLSAGRWNPRRKQQFINSRASITRDLTILIGTLDEPPRTLLSGSAIGWYGPHDDQPLDESALAQPSFSHDLCDAWEAEARTMETFGVRVCRMRIGVVLGHGGGPLGQLCQSHKMKVSAVLGSGEQVLSWIHLDDMIALMLFLIDHPEIEGAVNCTAPGAVTQRDFAKAVAKHIPTWITISVPATLLRVALGEMADEMVLSGQRVIPMKLLDTGFNFQYATLPEALNDLLG